MELEHASSDLQLGSYMPLQACCDNIQLRLMVVLITFGIHCIASDLSGIVDARPQETCEVEAKQGNRMSCLN